MRSALFIVSHLVVTAANYVAVGTAGEPIGIIERVTKIILREDVVYYSAIGAIYMRRATA